MITLKKFSDLAKGIRESRIVHAYICTGFEADGGKIVAVTDISNAARLSSSASFWSTLGYNVDDTIMALPVNRPANPRFHSLVLSIQELTEAEGTWILASHKDGSLVLYS